MPVTVSRSPVHVQAASGGATAPRTTRMLGTSSIASGSAFTALASGQSHQRDASSRHGGRARRSRPSDASVATWSRGACTSARRNAATASTLRAERGLTSPTSRSSTGSAATSAAWNASRCEDGNAVKTSPLDRSRSEATTRRRSLACTSRSRVARSGSRGRICFRSGPYFFCSASHISPNPRLLFEYARMAFSMSSAVLSTEWCL